MWDYSYAIPTLMMLMIFFGFYFALPRIPIIINKIFLCLLIVESMVITLDILSSIVDTNYQMFPLIMLDLFNTLYFVFFIFRAYIFYLFSANVFEVSLYRNRIRGIIVQLPFLTGVVFSVLSPVFKTIYSIQSDGFHREKFYIIIYFVYWIYIALTYYVVFKYRRISKFKRELTCVFSYNTILLMGTFFRYFFPKYLLMDTFCVMAITAIYLTFGNPEFYIEARTKVYNSRALREYITQISGKRSYRIFSFVIRNYKEVRELYGSKQMDNIMAVIGDFLVRYLNEYYVFYYKNGRFIVIGNDSMDFSKMRKEISERFRNSWKTNESDVFLDVSYAVMNPGKRNFNADVVLNTIAYTLEKINTSDGDGYVEIGEKEFLEIQDNTEIKRALEFAIDHNLVEIFLQPIIECESGKMVGAEVLARIRDAEGNIIPPGLFIPMAEKNGRINQLGEQVIEKACRFINDENFNKIGLSWINVNLSPIQFIRSDIDNRLSSILKKYGVTPGKIHLEITEETMIDEVMFLKRMRMLERKGFFFVLDDYGKGYSNFTRVRKCPFINIKIDMALVREHCNSPDEMLPGIIDTFKKMGFSITAEGVEDESMAKELKRIGTDYLQGYLFSKPMPVDEFVKKYS